MAGRKRGKGGGAAGGEIKRSKGLEKESDVKKMDFMISFNFVFLRIASVKPTWSSLILYSLKITCRNLDSSSRCDGCERREDVKENKSTCMKQQHS